MTVQVLRWGLGHELIDYHEAWQRQRQLHAEVAAGARPATALLLEHAPVYTAGRRTEASERPADGTPVVDVDRGGKITWHGPGQLVGYPLVRLAAPIDVVGYVRRLEGLLIEACQAFGLDAVRVDGRSGVWLPPGAGRSARKVAAIGVRVSRQVTMHGFALNCSPDLAAFARIVPCGISDAGVTSLSVETGRHVGVLEAADVVERLVRATDLGGTPRPLRVPA